MSPRLAVRVASRDDLDAVRLVCLSAVGDDDYVLHDLDRWFASGEVSIAEAEGAGPVAVMRTIHLADGAAWLASIRTAKEWQGKGVATHITTSAMERARGRGLRYGRLLISAKNTASLRVAEKCGLQEVFRVAVLEKGEEEPEEDVIRRQGRSQRKERGPEASPAGSPEALAALVQPLARDEVERSPIIAGLGGYAGLFFTFVKGEREVIGRCAPRTLPVLVDGERFLFTANRSAPWHGLQPLSHGPGVGKAAVRALEIGGIGEGVVFLPMDEALHRPYLESGFKYSGWAKEAVILERDLASLLRVGVRPP